MIYFFADDHFGKHPGQLLHEQLPEDLKNRMVFTENEWELLESGRWVADCELLVLHFIGATCGQPMPGEGALNALREYVSRGGNILLLHGSSAALWGHAWWRGIVGMRWVRPNDPDGVEPSTHPHAPCHIALAKTRHPLMSRLQAFDLEYDEIYINLEQVNPVTIFLSTEVEGKTYPQAFETVNPSGSVIASFIPGHLPVNTQNPVLVKTVVEFINYLLERS